MSFKKMSKHSFVYSIVEEFIAVDKQTLKEIKKINLKKDKNLPNMVLTSYYNDNNDLKKFLIKKLNNILKKYNLNIRNCWVQKYQKGHYHNVHTHSVYDKSFVWFIEGNEKSSPVKFYDIGYPLIDTNQSCIIDFVVGKLLIFPGFIPHEVLPNPTTNRLVISGNVF